MAFFDKELTQTEFQELIAETQRNKEQRVKNIVISGFTLPFDEIKDISFANTKWNNIDAKNKTFSDVKFSDCEITDSDFSGIKLHNVEFTNCKIRNVIFNEAQFDTLTFTDSEISSTDTNPHHSYRNMVGDEIHFNNSEITSLNFFHSKMKVYFEKSKMMDISSYGLKEGSLLSIKDSEATLIEFSKSDFSILEVRNSTIKQSRANNCRIGTVLLEDSDLGFPIGDGKGYDKVIAKNTKNVIVGGTPVKEVTITDCGKSNDVFVAGMTFDKMVIKDCSPLDFSFHDSKGKLISISNMETVEFDLEDMDVEHMILENIYVRGDLRYENAKVQKLETKNISFDSDIKIKSEGANFELKPDVIKPAEY